MRNVIEQVVGKPDLKRVAKDSDKDGLMDILDCQPHNPKKQGVIHSIGAKVARGLGAEETADKIEARGERLDEEKTEAREFRREERKSFKATERESFKEERQKVAMKRGVERARSRPGQSFGKFIGEIAASQPRSALGSSRRESIRNIGKKKGNKGKWKKGKGKKGKGKKGVVRRAVESPRQQSMLDIKF